MKNLECLLNVKKKVSSEFQRSYNYIFYIKVVVKASYIMKNICNVYVILSYLMKIFFFQLLLLHTLAE